MRLAVARRLEIAERTQTTDDYRFGLRGCGLRGYGFNGQEKSEELGSGMLTAKFWQYDAKIGRRWNVDPVVKPHESGYACFADNPILFVDPNGDD